MPRSEQGLNDYSTRLLLTTDDFTTATMLLHVKKTVWFNWEVFIWLLYILNPEFILCLNYWVKLQYLFYMSLNA